MSIDPEKAHAERICMMALHEAVVSWGEPSSGDSLKDHANMVAFLTDGTVYQEPRENLTS